MKKFRKAYIVCRDNEIFGNVKIINTYRERSNADEVCDRLNKEAIDQASHLSNKNKPISVYKVHGFYLVHEGLFE